MLNSYLELNFENVKRVDNSRYANGNDIQLVNLRSVALFSIVKLTTSSGKHLEDISRAHIVPLIYKLTYSAKDTNHLSFGFNRSRDTRRDELGSNKNIKGKYHLRIMLKYVFGFAEHQQKTTYGLGYKITPTRNKDEAVIDEAAGIADARTKADHIHWYVPHYTPSVQQQDIVFEQILNKTPTELRYVEGFVFMKEVKNQNA